MSDGTHTHHRHPAPAGRRLRTLLAVAATLVLAGWTSASASANATRALAPVIASPGHTFVSGQVEFAAGRVGTGVERVVFAVDGRRMWSTSRHPYRYRRTGLLNTRTLRNGRHVLSLTVFYRRREPRRTHKTIVVSNPTALVASVGAFGPPAGGVPGPSVAEFNRATFQFTTGWPMSLEASRYQIMVLQSNQHYLVPILHALNPSLKVLVYQNIMHTNDNSPANMPTATACTGYQADLAAHPDWFLHDQYGRMIAAPYVPGGWVMDPGNPAYQVQCAAGAVALAKQYGFDGVFWDTVMGRLDEAVGQGLTVPEYPTSASWVSAMTSALDYIAPTLRSQGLISVGNIAGTPTVAVWEQWASVLDGVEEESWTDGGLGTMQQVPYWSTKLAELAWTQANGRYEIVHSYNGSEAANTYGLASMLLAARGTASYATANTNYTSNENWFPEYSLAQQLGAPAGPYAVLRNGVYERAFSKGIVLVNPTAATVPAFSLGGGVYSGSGLSNVSSLSMAPASGLILLKVG